MEDKEKVLHIGTYYGSLYGNVIINNPQPPAPVQEAEVTPVSEDFVNPCIETVKALVEKGSSIVVPAMLAKYRDFWRTILADELFITAFQEIEPRGFEGNYNQKLFCNILGFLNEHGFFKLTSAKTLGEYFYAKNVRSYIYNYLPVESNSSDSSLNERLLAKMKYLMV